MFHEPPKNFLYSSYRVDAKHTDSSGTSKEGIATGFVVEGRAGEAWFITNRHVVDLDYRQATAKFKDFQLTEFSITGRRSDDSIYTFGLHPSARMFFHDDEENDVVVIEGAGKVYGIAGAEKSVATFLYNYAGKNGAATPVATN